MPEIKKLKRAGLREIENHPILRNPALRKLIINANAQLDVEFTNNQQVRLLGHFY